MSEEFAGPANHGVEVEEGLVDVGGACEGDVGELLRQLGLALVRRCSCWRRALTNLVPQIREGMSIWCVSDDVLSPFLAKGHVLQPRRLSRSILLTQLVQSGFNAVRGLHGDIQSLLESLQFCFRSPATSCSFLAIFPRLPRPFFLLPRRRQTCLKSCWNKCVDGQTD